MCVCVCVRSLSCVRLFVTPWNIVCQAPPSMGFPGKDIGVGCHFLLQENQCTLYLISTKFTEVPCSPGLGLCGSTAGGRVPSLVEELKSCKPHNRAKKRKRKKKKNPTKFTVRYFIKSKVQLIGRYIFLHVPLRKKYSQLNY